MNKSLLLIGLGALSISLSACQQHLPTREVVWSAADKKAAPALDKSQFKEAQVTSETKVEITSTIPQKLGPAIVDKGYAQKVFDKSGELVYLKANIVEGDLSHYAEKAQKLEARKFALLNNLKSKIAELKSADHVFDPQVILSTSTQPVALHLAVDYVPKAGLSAYRLLFSEEGRLVSRQSVASHLTDGVGTVFPEGPRMGFLREVTLASLIGDGTLTSRSLKVLSADKERAYNPELVYNYDTNDPRFDQVQAYYFVDRALSFFKSSMGVTIPFPIEVHVHVGAPKKTNAAFYYHGQIRLGEGDGVTYAHMIKDPSIVTHETAHALVDTLAGLPFEGEGGSLNEGFADIVTAIMLENPRLAEASYKKAPFRRTVENELTVADKKGALYFDSSIFSGTLWEVKTQIGNDATIKLITKLLPRLGRSADFKSVGPALEDSLNADFTLEHKSQIISVFKKRGWL